jgi:hypothetical protein
MEDIKSDLDAANEKCDTWNKQLDESENDGKWFL